MSKYIIEIAKEYEEYFKGILICGIADGKFAVDVIAREDLEELSSDYINEHFSDLQDTAYQRGFDDGKLLGQNESWECARKIVCDDSCGGMDMKELLKIFNRGSDAYILRDFTAQQAIEKIKAYKQKQADKIEVGDEVKHKSEGVKWTAVVTCIRSGTLTLMGHSGVSADNYPIEDFVKTGRHFDIAKILEAMKA